MMGASADAMGKSVREVLGSVRTYDGCELLVVPIAVVVFVEFGPNV